MYTDSDAVLHGHSRLLYLRRVISVNLQLRARAASAEEGFCCASRVQATEAEGSIPTPTPPRRAPALPLRLLCACVVVSLFGVLLLLLIESESTNISLPPMCKH